MALRIPSVYVNLSCLFSLNTYARAKKMNLNSKCPLLFSTVLYLSVSCGLLDFI